MKKVAAVVIAVSLPVLFAGGDVSAESAAPGVGSPAATAAPLRSYAPDRNPGTTDFDVTDRMAITNLISAYAFAYDNTDADAWLSLFTPDAVFVAAVPGQTPVSFTGHAFRTFWTKRMAEFRTSGNLRRHLMANVLFLDQTADTAHVSVVGLLTNAKDGKTFTAVSSLNYEGWIEKGPEGWKIRRWHDFPDAAFPE